jgi:hypothetical protein
MGQQQQQMGLRQEVQPRPQQQQQHGISRSRTDEQEQLLLLPDISCTLIGGSISLEASEQLLGRGLSPAELDFLTQMPPRIFTTATAATAATVAGLPHAATTRKGANTGTFALQTEPVLQQLKEEDSEAGLSSAASQCNQGACSSESMAGGQRDVGGGSSSSSVYSSICFSSYRNSMEMQALTKQPRPWASSSVSGVFNANGNVRSADLLVVRHSASSEEMGVFMPNQEASWGSGEAVTASCRGEME